MMKPDQDSQTHDEPSAVPNLLRMALVYLGATGAILFTSVVLGFITAVVEDQAFGAVELGILAVFASLAALCGWGAWRAWRWGGEQVEAASVKRSRIVVFVFMIAGGFLGALISAGSGADFSALSNGPVDPIIAGLAIAMWFIIASAGTILWLRSVDEHEREAYQGAASAAAHVYLVLVPAWWMATRAGWLPAQEPMVLFLLVIVIWTLVWFVRRYR